MEKEIKAVEKRMALILKFRANFTKAVDEAILNGNGTITSDEESGGIVNGNGGTTS